MITFTKSEKPPNMDGRPEMTTESKQDTPRRVSPLRGAAAISAAAVLVVSLIGLAVGGAAAGAGAVVGGLLAFVVLTTSTAVVNVVAGLMPGASLLIAGLTFVLQVLLLAVVAMALRDAALRNDAFSPGWFAGGIIGVTMTWITAHTWLYTRLRVPAWDLTTSHRPGGES